MLNKFEVGDVVRLKSGGPLMTVNQLWRRGSDFKLNEVECKWFEKTELHTDHFVTSTLEKIDEYLMRITPH